MTQRFQDIAKRFAKSREDGGVHFDSVRFAGVSDGYEYYHYFDSRLVGMKLGMPLFVKIGRNGKPIPVTDFAEINFAIHREVSLNNPS